MVIQVKEGEKSFFWSGKYHMDLNRRDTLVTDLNVLAAFDPILPEKYTIFRIFNFRKY
jgi:hypothetical protein